MLTGQAVARAALRAGTAVSCSSSTELQGFTPVLSSTSSRSSFLEGITHTASLLCYAVCPGAVVAAGEVHCSWPCCCASFPWAFLARIFWTLMGAQKAPTAQRSRFLLFPPLGSQKSCLPSSFPGQVWDERLARAAEAWAARCLWDHGPPELMKYVGQNLSIQSGR